MCACRNGLTIEIEATSPSVHRCRRQWEFTRALLYTESAGLPCVGIQQDDMRCKPSIVLTHFGELLSGF